MPAPAPSGMSSARPLLRDSSRPGVGSASTRATRRMVLVSRVVCDVGAVLIGLEVANGGQQRLAAQGLVQPLGAVGLFNVIVIASWLALFAGMGLYDAQRLVNALDELVMVLQAVAMGTVLAVFAAFLLKVPTQRSWVLTAWIGCTLAVLITRLLHRRILRGLRASGIMVSRMLIVGASSEARELCRAIVRAPHLGFRVVGFLDGSGPAGMTAGDGSPDIVGETSCLREAVPLFQVDAVLVASGSVEPATAERVYRDLQGVPVDLYLSTGLLGVAASRAVVERFDGIPLIGLRPVDLSGFQSMLKRGFDVAVSGLAIVALAPVFLLCALAIRLSSPGPVLFRQERVGRDGQVFKMHKLRSMTVDAADRLASLRDLNEADGPIFKLREDPRVTGIGGWLRSWSLDELPQLFDVLRGDMSLVGPRPLPTYEVDPRDSLARDRLRVRPGMTGLWQVSGRHRLSYEEMVHHDLFYIGNWSLSMDLLIVLRTIIVALRRSGV
jgi:exopolysaccharide biosynthesis polyprenyl glycosylphosphotransferase